MTGSKFFIRIGVLIVLLVVLGGGGYWWWQDSLSPVDPTQTTPKTFVVKQGDTVRTIATSLKSQGLIKDTVAFFLLTRFQKIDDKVQAGDFRLSPAMDARQIAQELTHGSVDVWVTLLEGWRKEEVAQKLAQHFDIPESEFIKEAPEGYLFPDTYLLPKEASAGAIVEILQDNFNSRISDDIKKGISAQGLTLAQGVTLASIVEREGNSDSDRPIIAGVLLNRYKIKQPLQVDATLQYILGYQAQENSWWRKVIVNADKEIDSPYNTYLFAGLPPGPICNPGLSAIKAVANPVDTDYFYYIHDRNGVAHFAKTLDEHNENVAKYLN